MNVDRLAALGRLWGAVNYFHPSIAGRKVWWEEALRLAYERVGEDAESYRRTSAWMLGLLGDPATGVVPADTPHSPAAEPEPVLDLGDGILLLTVSAFRRYPAGSDMYARFDQAFRELGAASGLVLDLRRPGRLFEFGLLRSLVGALIDSELTLPGTRRRYHSGLPSEATETVVASESGLLLADPARVPPQGANPFLSAVSLSDKPTVLIVSDANEPGYPHALALRARGRAQLVHAGAAFTTAPGQVLEFCDDLRVRIRTAQFVPETGVDPISADPVAHARDLLLRGVTPQPIPPAEPPQETEVARIVPAAVPAAARRAPAASAAAAAAAAPLYPTPTPSAPYAPPAAGAPGSMPPRLPAPSQPERLVAAAKLWSAANWFFAHKDLCDEPWDDALAASLPRFLEASDGLSYAQAVNDLAIRLCDTHAVTKSRALMAARGGPATVPALVRTIDGAKVVIAVGPGAEELRVGDVVLSVDGEKIEERRERLGEMLSHSSAGGRSAVVDGMLLSGPFAGEAELRVESADGAVRTVRAGRGQAPPRQHRFGRQDCDLLDEGIGYLDLTAIGLDRIDDCFARLADCSGLVFDLRGTPGSGVRRAAARLTGTPRTYGFDCYPTPTLAVPSIRREELLIDPAVPGECYGGRTAALIDERTISHGEVTLLMLLGATGGALRMFGESSSGVVGHPTEIQLPGQVRVCFSAVDVRDRLGNRIQRTGIAPDVPVKATLNGIRAGRDEVLEAAVSWLRTTSGTQD